MIFCSEAFISFECLEEVSDLKRITKVYQKYIAFIIKVNQRIKMQIILNIINTTFKLKKI